MIPSWVGRYLNVPHETLNCWSLIQSIYLEQFDIDIGDANLQPSKMREKDWTEVADYQLGDIALFRNDRHVGMVITSDKMIHSAIENGTSCIERFNTSLWKNRLDGMYRHARRT